MISKSWRRMKNKDLHMLMYIPKNLRRIPRTLMYRISSLCHCDGFLKKDEALAYSTGRNKSMAAWQLVERWLNGLNGAMTLGETEAMADCFPVEHFGNCG